MEQWENDLRAELAAEFTEGEYKLSQYPRIITVDKAGMIDYLVGEEKKRRQLAEFYSRHQNTDKESEQYKKEFSELMNKFKNKNHDYKNS
jgi:hypothetical protein